jgi:hypothetical protein
MVANFIATSCTQQVDTRYHFLKDIDKDGVFKIVFVQSEENRVDK